MTVTVEDLGHGTPPRMSDATREAIALHIYLSESGTAVRSIARTLHVTPDEARAMCERFRRAERRAREAAELLSRGHRVIVADTDDGGLYEHIEFSPEGAVLHVASEDAGTGSDEVGTKRCLRCGGVFPVTRFVIRRRSRDGLCCYCRDCMRELSADWARRNRAKLREPAPVAPDSAGNRTEAPG